MPDHGPIAIEAFVLGDFQTNCFVVRSVETGSGFVADCGFEPGALLDGAAGLAGGGPEAIVLTHAHVDHIAGLREARRRFPEAPIWIHRDEELWLTDAERNLSALAGMPITAPAADRLLTHGETVDLAGASWRVIHTPGHSPGGAALYCEAGAVAIVGDALFAGSIGRTDFPGSSFDELAGSIRGGLYTLPDETVIYPGHGPASTIGREKSANAFVRA